MYYYYRAPALLGAEEYPCADVTTTRTAGVMGLIEAEALDFVGGSFTAAGVDFTDPSTYDNFRLDMSFRPIVLSAGGKVTCLFCAFSCGYDLCCK